MLDPGHVQEPHGAFDARHARARVETGEALGIGSKVGCPLPNRCEPRGITRPPWRLLCKT